MTTISPAYGPSAAQTSALPPVSPGGDTSLGGSSGMPMKGMKSAMPQGGPELNNMVKGPFGQLPSPGGPGASGQSGAGDQVKAIFADLYKETMQKAQQTQDPKLKAHYMAEAQILKTLIGGGAQPGGAQPGGAQPGGPQPGGPQAGGPQAGGPQQAHKSKHGHHPCSPHNAHQPCGSQQSPQAGGPQQPPQAGGPQQPPQAGGPQQPPQAGGPQQPPQAGGPQQPPQAGGPQGGSPTGGPAAGQSDPSSQGGPGQSPGGSADQIMQVFGDMYQEAMQKAAQAKDPQTQQHYAAEAQVLKATVTALMGGGASGQAGPQGGAPGGASPVDAAANGQVPQTNTDTAA